MATGAIAVIEEDSMHPTTMQAIAAQRGRDFHREATAAQRARLARLSQSWHQARLTQKARPVVPVLPIPRTRRELKPAAG